VTLNGEGEEAKKKEKGLRGPRETKKKKNVPLKMYLPRGACQNEREGKKTSPTNPPSIGKKKSEKSWPDTRQDQLCFRADPPDPGAKIQQD
jgi:hypothetical protein